MAAWQYSIDLFPAEYARSIPDFDVDARDNFPGWQDISLSKLSLKLIEVFGTEMVLHGVRNFGKSEDSCASLLYDEKSDLVREISFRFDLRKSIKTELEAVIGLARSLNAVIVTEDLSMISSESEENLKEAIANSRAAKFVKDPVAYFNSISPEKD